MRPASFIPTSRSGKKRPRDINERAKLIVDIATGEAEEKPEDEGKIPLPRPWVALVDGRVGRRRRRS